MYETVRSERNKCSKSLIESQERIAEMKRTFTLMTHNIEQLKEEISMKDTDMRNEETENERVKKEIEVLKNEQTKIKKQIQSSEHIAANQQDEISKLTRIIREAEAEKIRQIRELESVVNERDALGTQLVGRNQELAKLYVFVFDGPQEENHSKINAYEHTGTRKSSSREEPCTVVSRSSTNRSQINVRLQTRSI